MIYLGVMSGTSMDGADAALADFSGGVNIVASASADYDDQLRAELLALNRPGGKDELARAACAANRVAAVYAAAIARCLRRAGVSPAQVRAAGCHGQTVRHAPRRGFSTQLLNGALLAELSGIDIVCDFRAACIAAGGEGAPLAPAFHRCAFGRRGAVVNIGGIANITALKTGAGWDCGPGNLLMDAWHQKRRGAPFDRGGKWAASGAVVPALLKKLQAHPFLRRPPPKSCGREDFDLPRIFRAAAGHSPEDAQATFLELSAQAIRAAADIALAGERRNSELILCGGGARNAALRRRLRELLPAVQVVDSGARGIPPKLVEAAAFAWFAGKRIRRRAIASSAILGAVYPRPRRGRGGNGSR